MRVYPGQSRDLNLFIQASLALQRKINRTGKQDAWDQQPSYLHQNLDDRTAQMVSLHENQYFQSSRNTYRMRLIMLVWVIRSRVIGNLKRYLDISLCLLCLPPLIPILLITALAIKLDSPGPVFFNQVRVGKWGKLFNLFKFRSMYVDAERRKAELMPLNEADQIVFKMKRDPRVTRVGRIIRKLSIDELPQIFNVLRGDMSLVGPRPPVPYEVDQYQFQDTFRLSVLPGITGLQQVSGRSELDFKHWVELDLKYIQEQSLLKDLEILVKTIPAVITGRGAY